MSSHDQMQAKENVMKLTSVRINRAVAQFDARPVPDNHPSMQQLTDLFGDHTFFLTQDGLNIVEPYEPYGDENTGRVVKVASWTDESQLQLEPHGREPTDVFVELGRAA
jgi:hypothetical protein